MTCPSDQRKERCEKSFPSKIAAVHGCLSHRQAREKTDAKSVFLPAFHWSRYDFLAHRQVRKKTDAKSVFLPAFHWSRYDFLAHWQVREKTDAKSVFLPAFHWSRYDFLAHRQVRGKKRDVRRVPLLCCTIPGMSCPAHRHVNTVGGGGGGGGGEKRKKREREKKTHTREMYFLLSSHFPSSTAV